MSVAHKKDRHSNTMVEHSSCKHKVEGLTPGLPCLTKVVHSLEGYDLRPPVPHNWIIKGSAMCYHVCVVMHVKDPQLFFVKSRA